MICVEN